MNPDNNPINLPQVNDPASPATGSSQLSDSSSVAPILPDNENINKQPVGQVASVPVPDEAADSDLIEKEWVERAKQIVEHTKDDPHEQQRAVSQMKADYLKKRYNKDIGAVSD